MSDYDIAQAKRDAVALIEQVALGERLKRADLEHVFGATAIFELFVSTFPAQPAGAQFARVTLDKLLNLDHVAEVDLQAPTPIDCTRCKTRGRIVERDRQIVCPQCEGAGRHIPPNTDTVIVLKPQDGGPGHRVNFRHDAEAREYFERIAQRANGDEVRQALTGLPVTFNSLRPLHDPARTAQAVPAQDKKPMAPTGNGRPISTREPWKEPPPTEGAELRKALAEPAGDEDK